jgi:CHAT domain-containing protein
LLPAGTKQLLVAPDGELALLPFEALRLADGSYLIEHYAVSYVSSGRDLLPRPRPRERGPALVLADPDYDALGERHVAASPGSAGALRSDDFRQQALRFQRLSGFAAEATAVARLLKAQPGWQLVLKQRAQAEEEVLSQVRRPRLLYLITHGFFLKDLERPRDERRLRSLGLVSADSGRPALPPLGQDPRLRSGLALAGANRWQQRSERGLSDGLLTALEVEGLDLLGCELVVLSACETGLGQVQVG